ncbi:hypothetical protein [Micromonospora sp. NPDC023737]|uniref:hypothetical protein n=1 Tax=unclassified Micromonospora TaxID=2617518 RepID=UPI0033C9B0B6
MTKVMRTQLKRLPILHNGRHMDDDLVLDFVQDFAEQRWERTVTAILTGASDDESMQPLLSKIVYNWLVDGVRKTDVGSVLRRLREHLTEDSTFEMVAEGEPGAGRWRLSDTDGPPWGGRIEDLVAAAYRVPARAVRWSDPTRRPPIANAADLTAVLREVLEAAGGKSVELHQLVAVIVQRFPATLDPESRAIDEERHPVQATELPPDLAWEVQLEASEQIDLAASIFAQLTSQERQLLPLLVDVSAVQAHLGCGRSTAYTKIKNLKVLIQELTGACDDPEQVGREVLVLCTG